MAPPTRTSLASHTLLRVLPAPPGFARYLAAPTDLPDQHRVLTHLRREHASDIEASLAFRELAALESRVRADAVIPVLEVGEADGLPYIIREHRVGAELTDVIAQRLEHPARFSPAAAATIANGVIEALIAAHALDLHHMRLEPSTVLIDPGGDVSVTGFAEGAFLARFPQKPSAPKDIAPELRRNHDGGAQTDSYGVGMLLFRLLTGREQPDEWEPRWTGMMMELSAAGVPGDGLKRLIDFLHRALAERPSQRFANANALARAMGPVMVDLDGPKPRQVIAHLLEPLFTSSGPGTREVELISADEAVPTNSSDDDDATPIVQHTGYDAPRSTRIMAAQGARASLRRLSPELRERIGPHPLEVLARSRYQVLGELGIGGTGTVYKVLDTTLSEVLALKMLSVDLTSDPGWLQRFKRELTITRDLEHPSILPAYHLEQLEGLYFFTMRYVDGETLYDAIRQRGALPLREGLRILSAVGAGLSAAHSHSIIHRDIKSANIMLERVTGVPYLMDFGIALAPDNPGLTITGQGIGTPMYMAPEQARGERIGTAADIYSFGVVMYETLSGELPFIGTTTVAVYTKQMQGAYDPLTVIAPHVPPALTALTEHCMALDPEQRPASMDEVLKTLGAVE